MHWKVRAATTICVVKAATSTAKMPFALTAAGQHLSSAGGFHFLIGASGLVGAWLLPRLTRRYSSTVCVWIMHLSGILSHVLSVAMPESSLPIIPGTLTDPTFLGTALLDGCRVALSATEEEVGVWRQTSLLAGLVGLALAPLLATFSTSSFDSLNLVCLAADIAITPMLCCLPTAVEAPPSHEWSWSRTLSLRSLWALPGLWMISWSFAQAMEHSITQSLIWVLWVQRFAPTPVFAAAQTLLITIMGIVNTALVYRVAERGSESAPQLLLLCAVAVLAICRWAAAVVSNVPASLAITVLSQVGLCLMSCAKTFMWQRCVAKEGEAEGVFVLQQLVDSVAPVLGPYTLYILGFVYQPWTIMAAWPPITLGILVAGQLGFAVLLLWGKPKTA